MALGIWSRFQSILFGGAIGAAASDAIAPALEPAKQHAWSKNQNRVLDAGRAAELVAQGLVAVAAAESEAARTGFNPNRLAALVQLAQEAPGIAETLELWRRDKITEAQVDVALAKSKLLPDFWPAVKELFYDRLDPAVIATAIQRGIMTDPGFLPVGPPTAEGKVPKFPVSKLDPVAESKAQGIDKDRLFVETAIVGNPASPDLAARMTFRGIIDQTDFYRAIAEGNTRNEWASFLFDGFRQINTAHDWVELHLRGYIDKTQMYAGTALHGMSEADTDRLFQVLGRPLAVHQITTGLARGGKFNPIPGELTDPFEASVHEANIKPSFYDLAIANRYTYPSAFVIRALTSDGTFSGPQAEQILLEVGWRPDLAKLAAAKWAATVGTSGKDATAANLRAEYEGMFISRAQLVTGLEALGYDPHEADLLANLGDAARVKTYRDAVVKAVYNAFKAHSIDRIKALSDLATVGVDLDGANSLVSVWEQELDVAVKTLTAAQIKRAFKAGTLTRAMAVQELEDKGYSATDAGIYLDS